MRSREGVSAYTPLPGDRRRGRRSPLEMDVTLTGTGALARGISVDISDGGVFICLSQAHVFRVGQATEIALTLPGGGKVVAGGEVRWMREAQQGVIPGIGIAFSHMSPIDRAMIGRYLSS